MAVVTTKVLEHMQNTIFKKTSKVTITESKWMITFMIDLKPYEVLLKKLGSEIEQTQSMGEKIEDSY